MRNLNSFHFNSSIKTKTWSDSAWLPVIRRLWQLATTLFKGRQSRREYTCRDRVQ